MPYRVPLVFAHGNGIPRPVYQKLLIGLAHRFVASGVDRLGHDPRFPASDAWVGLRDQLLDHMARVREPAVLLGHGSGGWLALLAAYQAPERVAAVILLDAPLPTPLQSRALGLLQQVGLGGLPSWLGRLGAPADGIDPECRALYRRFGCAGSSLPESAPEPAADHAADHAADARDAPSRRRFDASVRRRIGQTAPTRLATLIAAGPPTDASGRVVPCGALVGEASRVARLLGLAASRRLVGPHLQRIAGSHLFPLERPLVTAKEVVHLYDRMAGASDAGRQHTLQPLLRLRTRSLWQPAGG